MSPKPDPMGTALSVLNRMAGSPALDRLKLRKPLEKVLYRGTRDGFKLIDGASRRFRQASARLRPQRLADKPVKPLFDLNLSEEQEMIRESMSRFARESLRPAGLDADNALATEPDILAAATELGITHLNVPEDLDGAATERSPVTNAVIAEALAHGDMGQALAILAPAGVANALVQFGSGAQQARYLPALLDDTPCPAALAISEPRPLFDALQPRCKAQPDGDGFRLHGRKNGVPLAATAELLLVLADLPGRGPQLFCVEPEDAGVTRSADPGMGLRAAAIGQVDFHNCWLPADRLLGGDTGCDAAQLLRLGKLGWCALACGTAQAVLDYVIPYCNDRIAFGEPVSHRQGVAFLIADLGIELEGMRLLLQRAASRAEQGLDITEATALAHAFCADKGMYIGTSGVQLLGGHGFTKEHPVERWYRDLRAVAIMDGGFIL